ncbi:dGTP triphosphohydrolase, partial [Romboutsia sp.]|uniref:dGTP triphosphohydrolase n=1 Tax=Romboutsia sp. TaxID=1965302 RepID=UPI003F401D77
MYINEKTKVLAASQEEAQRSTTIKEHDIRSKFQRDRDRILYSRAFRRLGGKTQVFLAAKDDHLRNRLTHSLEVNQISQTIAKVLGLNLELTEAIALGHDLGHTPFGHVGERTLNHIMNGCYKIADFNTNINPIKKGFKHNFQGIRVVTELEENSLNLTKEVLWGILNHSKLEYKSCKKKQYIECNLKHSKFKSDSDCSNTPKYRYNLDFYDGYLEELDSSKYWTIEALVV